VTLIEKVEGVWRIVGSVMVGRSGHEQMRIAAATKDLSHVARAECIPSLEAANVVDWKIWFLAGVVKADPDRSRVAGYGSRVRHGVTEQRP
jgi:hypothetical protein